MPNKALLLTFLVSFIFFVGMLIPRIFKNKNKLLLISNSLTFVIMLFLALFDLLPEIIEILNPFGHIKNLLLFIVFIILGIFILKILDMFIPEHSHEHHDGEENIEKHNEHVFHIGFITSLSLIIHNILEGISIYITGSSDLKLGFMMALSVGIHNLPLGIEVAASLEASHGKKSLKIATTIILILSSFIGAFLLYLFDFELSELVQGLLLSLTFGMLLYIMFFELLNELKQNIKHKSTWIGLGIGVLFVLLLLFI